MDGMKLEGTARREGRLALGCIAVAWVGFVVDASILSLLEHFGCEPAWARVISLATAMQATFWINGTLVFRCVSRHRWRGAWVGYMASSAFGNFCNYWAFVTLVSLHDPVWSNR